MEHMQVAARHISDAFGGTPNSLYAVSGFFSRQMLALRNRPARDLLRISEAGIGCLDYTG